MAELTFLKNKADLLYKDYKTLTIKKDSNGNEVFEYHPKTFDIKSLFDLFGYNHEKQKKFKHSNALHMIAQMVGAYKWNYLIKAPDDLIEGANLLISHFKNADDVLKWLLLNEGVNPVFSQFRYLSNAQSFIDDPDDFRRLVEFRLHYVYDGFSEVPKFVVTKQKDESFSCKITEIDKFEEISFNGKTEAEAIENCAKGIFSFIEPLFIHDHNAFDDRRDCETLIRFLANNNFIKFPTTKITPCTDENGEDYIFCSFTCKRLFKTIHYEGNYYTEEDALNDVWNKVIDDVVYNEEFSKLD